MSKTLSIGDVANLRSGGPAITVVGFEKADSTPVHSPDLSPRGFAGLVKCIWFDEGGRLQTHAFPHGLLDMASEAPKEEPDKGAAAEDRDARADVERRNAEVRRILAQNAQDAKGLQAQSGQGKSQTGNPNANF